ncbi:MAG: hypothetical protein HDS68_01925 [Bacteroidales bacterium]|nr:hypothetical protein [Bacteroidales bacterium]
MKTGSSVSPFPEASLSKGGDNQIELPRYHKRAFAHNYHAPFIYHIIIKKRTGFEPFGIVGGDARNPPGTAGCAYIKETVIGQIIAKEIIRIQKTFPILQIYQFKVMPDHVHILLRVKEWSEHHLDHYIASIADNVAASCSIASKRKTSADEIFQPGYCDKPLLLKRNLDDLYRYIRENPHRLAMRQQYPQFFQRVRKLKIGENEYEAYGNMFLFRNPDKEAVKISRSFTPEEKSRKKADWLHSAAKGTILVSPFISKEEKSIRTEAESLGAGIILITHESFPDRFKPAAHDFALCTTGRLLIISLGLPATSKLSRPLCLRMNTLAATLAATLHPG